jgi:hypothetical protein
MSSFAPGGSPRSWRAMSLEYKCQFAYHSVMMLMFVAGGSLSITFEAAIASLLVVIGIILSLRHRQQVGWRWPGVHPSNIGWALIAIVGGVIFLGASTALFPPLQPHILPWYLAGAGIITFNVLQALRLVAFTEADFIILPSVGRTPDPDSAPHTADKPWWHTLLRLACYVIFMAAWLNFAAQTYFFGQAFQHGSPVPTAIQTERLQNHGQIVYVTSAEKGWLDLLEIGLVGIPLAIALSAFSHFVLGVNIWSRTNNTAYPELTIEGPVRICPSCNLRNIPERKSCKRCGTQLGPIEPPPP